jgi:hypothetical protein
VPSFPHEILVELFRQRPVLAPALLRACAGLQLEGARIDAGSIDLSQVAPTEYRSDMVSVLRDASGAEIAAVVVEIQLWIDEDKRRTWPLYVAAARASYGCPAILLVLAPDPAIARWASQPIELGHPGFVLLPVVISFPQVPRVLDPVAASALPELAVLSAMAHRDRETAEAAQAALPGLPEDLQKLYWDVILSGLPPHIRQAMEAHMIKGYVYQSDFARKYYFQGHDEGREEGLRQAIFALIDRRLPGLRDELEPRLRGCSEIQLLQLITELDPVHDEAGVRYIIERLS